MPVEWRNPSREAVALLWSLVIQANYLGLDMCATGEVSRLPCGGAVGRVGVLLRRWATECGRELEALETSSSVLSRLRWDRGRGQWNVETDGQVMMRDEITEHLRALRDALGWSQEHLATASGVSLGAALLLDRLGWAGTTEDHRILSALRMAVTQRLRHPNAAPGADQAQ